ncbi:MAG TPA: hypothetical protein VFZ85_12050 [Jiangellaceae bacterium]
MERLSPTDDANARHELVGRWKAAEQRLALLAVGDPDLYLRHLGAVGRVAERLRQITDVQELGAAYARWRTIVSPLVEGGGLDDESLAGTAWMVRWRELRDVRHAEQVAMRINDARQRGQSWVIVSETVPPATSALSYPCERTMMRAADGMAVRAAVEIDPDTYGPLYSLAVIRLDPSTGLEISAAACEPPEEFADRTAWERGLARLLSKLDASTP